MGRKTKIFIISFAIILSVMAGLVISVVYSVNAFGKTERIINNATFENIIIGGKTIKEAKELIEEEKELPLFLPISLEYGDKAFSFSPSDAGFEYDIDNILGNAYKIGREESFFKNVKSLIKSLRGIELKPQYKEDKAVFEKTIEELAVKTDVEFEPFSFTLKETYADIKINKDKTVIDFDLLLNETYKAIEENNERKISLPVKQNNSVSAEDIYKKLYKEPRNAKAIVENGETTVISHQVGVLLDKKEIEEALKGGKEAFRIKISKKYPDIRDEHLNGELFNDVLGACKSNYNAALIGRTRNVELAASKINGYILNPGDTFSYNHVVGPRTYAAGFKDATIYTNKGLEEGLGGGICQVSSTLYNAVLYADLKVVERKNHVYTVNYVRNGLDATVVYGAIDFKFTNDKKTPVKIVAYISNGVLSVSIVGRKDNNNTVELYTNTHESYPFTTEEIIVDTLEPGQRVVKQNGAYGYKISATKVVKDENGNVIRNEYLGSNTYKPITQIIEVGAGEIPVDAEIEASNPTDEEETIHPESGQPSLEENDSGKEDEIPEENIDKEEEIPNEESGEEVKEEKEDSNNAI